MGDETSITLAGDLAKPASVLVEKVSNAIGVLFEPRHVVRMANAEAKAELIRARGRLEAASLEDRTLTRLIGQESRKQQNIEQITARAIEELPEDATPEDLDEDWVAHFFKRCDVVSDDEMQSVWARLLAGEAAKPGSYSKRTVDLVESLSKSDARLFSLFCQFVWDIGSPTPLIFDHRHEVITKAGVGFPALMHLADIGLISFDSKGGYVKERIGKRAVVSYFDEPVLLEFPNDEENEFSIGTVLLTRSGLELARIAGAEKNEEYFEYCVDEFAKKKLCPSTPVARRKA